MDMSSKNVLSECHICDQIKVSGERDLCPCCDYDGCLHREDAVELLDWWVFSDSKLPMDEWFRAEVEKRAYRAVDRNMCRKNATR